MKRNLIFWGMLAAIVLLASCSAQRQLTSRLTSDWAIDTYEVRSPGGESTVIENAGSISFSSGSQGSQTFTTAILHAGSNAQKEFTWSNTERTVAIKSASSEFPKIWIIVDNSKNKQTWYSTDDLGNVQIMHLSRKK